MTLKEYLQRVKNGEKITIHTPTQRTYNKLMRELDKTDVNWLIGQRPTETLFWFFFDFNTCVRVDKHKGLCFYSKKFYRKRGFTIIPFSDLIFED